MDRTDQLPSKDQLCGQCHRPIHPSDSRRHFGFYVAHGEGRCVQLLQMEIETLTRKLDTCGLECSSTLKSLVAENERLRTCLTGISTCSTCEACRGAAKRALGDPLPAETRAATSRGAHSTEDAGRPGPSQPPGDGQPLGKCGYMFTESCGPTKHYRLVLGFENLADLQAAQDFVVGIRGKKPPNCCPTCTKPYSECRCNGVQL